jgi:putative hydrolase of the HAD superfamily
MKNAIIFDLYGTLVPNFTQSAYDPVYKEISSILDVGYDDFRKIFGTAFKERCRGKWKDIKNAIRDAAIHLGRAPTEITIERAAAVRLSFTRDSIQANNETLQVIIGLCR